MKRLLRFRSNNGMGKDTSYKNDRKHDSFDDISLGENASAYGDDDADLMYALGEISVGNMSDFFSIDTSTHAESEVLEMIPAPEKLIPILEENVEAKNHRYHFKVYPDCFVAKEAVNFLVEKQGLTRKQAVSIGKILQRDYRLFEHVTQDHVFRDANLFFRYFPKEERTMPIKDFEKAQNMTLLEIAHALEKGVMVLNRKHHCRPYPGTFVGSEAVDFLVKNGFADTRGDAVQLGRILFREMHLFEHCTYSRPFEDDNFFYRFKELKCQMKSKVASLTAEQALAAQRNCNNIIDTANALENGIAISDHTWRNKTYPDSFIASDAISFMVNSSLAKTRRDAVQLGRQMAKELHLFRHVTGEREFSDDYLFFEFTDDYDRIYPGETAPPTPYTEEELQNIANALRNDIKVKNLRYRTRVYSDAFIATDVIDYLVLNQYAASRRQALKLGRKLAKKFLLFRHVTGDHELKDEYLFFRFCDDAANDLESALDNISRPLSDIARAFRKNVKVSTHMHRLKSYRNVFLGSDAVDFLATMCKTRKDAVLIGRKIANDFNLFDHISRDHELKDEGLYYRFNTVDAITGGLILVEVNMTTQELRDIAKGLEANVLVGDNRFHLRVYKNTFRGCDAVDYLVKEKFCKSRSEAVRVARAINQKFNLFVHITGDHEFADEPHFFRYIKPDLRKLWTDKEVEAEKINDLRDDSELTSEELWNRKAEAFEAKMKKKMISKRELAFSRRTYAGATEIPSDLLPFMEETMDPKKALLYANTVSWMSTFRRTDPRFQILKFFTEVSQEGADDIEEKGFDAEKLRILSKYFYRASVFTVWRPTSFEAIKKMMLGTAVGKGLDIKGKSAKRGKLSAFVPFLQISENKHKRLIKRLSRSATVRLYFKGNARVDRDVVAEKLEEVCGDMIETVQEAKKILADTSADEWARQEAKALLSLDMIDPSISYLDDYCPTAYGIEVPTRLFWEAYVVRQDITREPGSIYDTGRPSQPAFQDMNFTALHASPKPGAARAILYQNAEVGSPMNPMELLMGYEENDRVKPVVSDFDCFLVGTRGVPFKNPLPNDQLETLKWCVNEIQNVLETKVEGEGWTSRWLEVLKAATSKGFHPEFPRFGFGDPKSYSIMQHAVGRLETEGFGAVRHGAECFNFYFPQELDEELLVISENLADNGNVPWRYMNVNDLQIFLNSQIDLGYTFPLNPKWIVCDPGWKQLYDRLFTSNKPNVQDSLNVWYPPESGLREQIEEIATRHPCGFQSNGDCHEMLMSPSMRASGTSAMDLALSELTSKDPGGMDRTEDSDGPNDAISIAAEKWPSQSKSGTAAMDLAIAELSSTQDSERPSDGGVERWKTETPLVEQTISAST